MESDVHLSMSGLNIYPFYIQIGGIMLIQRETTTYQSNKNVKGQVVFVYCQTQEYEDARVAGCKLNLKSCKMLAYVRHLRPLSRKGS